MLRLPFAFDGFHRGHLREGHKTARRDAAQTVLDAFEFAFPQWFSKPYTKTLHHQTTPLGGQEMSEFVDDDQDVEQHDHLQQNE